MKALRSAFLPAAVCLALAACEKPAETTEAAAPAQASRAQATSGQTSTGQTSTGQASTGQAAVEPVVLQTAMKDVVKPQTELVLNILIAALTPPPDPQVDASKLTDSDWTIMETAATALRDEAIALRDQPIQVVANPGDKLFGEVELGTNGAVQVQGYIDAYPDHFREDAEALRAKADEWLAAIEARDAAASWRVALEVDPACVECHEVFWSGDLDHISTDHEDER